MAEHRRLRLNRRLVLVTLTLLVTCSVGIVLAHRAQFAASVERSRQIGLSAAENENWHEAVAHLKLYLQNHPRDLEALSSCAHSLVEGYNELENAYELYERILEVDHYQHDTRRRFVALALKLGKTEAAVKHSQILAERYPADAEVMYLAGKSAEVDNRVLDAIRRYRLTVRLNELHAGANQRLAVLYKVVLDSDVASAQAIERLEQCGDRSFETLRTLSEYQLGQGHVEEANKLLIEAIDNWDDSTGQLISTTQISLRIAACEARQHGSQIAGDLQLRLQNSLLAEIEEQPESVFFDMSLAQLQAYGGQQRQSINTLQQAIERVPDNLDLRFQLTWQLIESSQFDAANESIARLRSSTHGSQETVEKYVNLLVAVATLQRGDVATAGTLLRSIVLEGVEPAAVAPIVGRLEAACHEQLAEWEAAVEAWQRVLRFEPNNRLVRLSLAFSLAASNRYADGIRILNSIPRLGTVLAKANKESSDHAESEGVNQLRPQFSLSELLSKNDSQLSPRARGLFAALLHVSRREYKLAHQAVESQDDIQERLLDIVALTKSSDVVDPSVLETIVEIDHVDARAVTAMLLSGSAAADENRLQRLTTDRLTGLDSNEWVKAAGVLASGVAGAARSVQGSDTERAEQLNAYAESVLNNMVEYDRTAIPQFVEYLISANRVDKAIEWCRYGWPNASERLAPLWLSAARQHPASQEKMAELEAVLFKALNHKNDSPSGVSVTADDAEGESAARVEVGLALADLYLMTGQDSLAESAYRQVLELQPDHVNALNNTAWLLFVAQRQLPFAARLVQRAIDSVGERADLLDTRGCVHLARGNNQAAAEDFTRALQLGAGPDSTFHLAVALQRSGEKDAARETLADARTHGFELAQVSPFEKRLALEIAD